MRRGGRLATSIFLLPGETVFLDQPATVKTILGSCVAVILHYPPLNLGAICHAVFPASNGEQNLKFVDQAVHYMLSYFDRQAIDRTAIVAKVFGGATTFGYEGTSVGSQNVAAATAALEQAGMRIAASDVGGTRGRKVLFNPYSGEILVKRFVTRRDCP